MSQFAHRERRFGGAVDVASPPCRRMCAVCADASEARDWIMRPVFGLLLAGVALEADYGGLDISRVRRPGRAAGGARMAPPGRHRPALGAAGDGFLAGLAIALALLALTLRPHAWYGWALVGGGVVLVGGLAALRGEMPLWQGAGVLYIGGPALALLASRAIQPAGAAIMLGLFIVVWMTDTGALFAGKLSAAPSLRLRCRPTRRGPGPSAASSSRPSRRRSSSRSIGGNAWRAALSRGTFGRGAGGRPFRILRQTAFHKKGQRHDDSRPWRRSRPHRSACSRPPSAVACWCSCCTSIRCSGAMP